LSYRPKGGGHGTAGTPGEKEQNPPAALPPLGSHSEL